MSNDATPAKVRLTDGLGPLVACPFCGEQEGYKLAEGDTYRWWLVQCKACGAGVAECHSDRRTQAGTELPQTWMAAHEAWNEAGRHTNELRHAVRALAARNAWALQAREVLGLIATPMRPDGTWNRDREACRQMAAEALGRYED